jgi:type II secretory pathway pseudopilin PulG
LLGCSVAELPGAGSRHNPATQQPSNPNRETAKPRNRTTAEKGFTLAGLLVIMTIMMIAVAYTVPRMWSTVMKRERERETLYAMQQYAKAIAEFRIKNNAYPTSPQQLKDARQPRMIRGPKGEFTDPLTGEVDWLVIPQAAGSALPPCAGTNANTPPGVQPPPPPPPPPPSSSDKTDSSGTNPNATPGLPGIPIKDYAGGPFIGVRPNAHGKSLMTVCNADTYEAWVYTSVDYDREKALRIAAAGTFLSNRR